MATSSNRPIKMTRGDSYAHQIILPAEDADADPIDWTGATFQAQVRHTADGPLLAEFDIDDTHTGDDPPFVVLTLPAVTVGPVAGTDSLPQRGVWDFQETRDGNTFTPIRGTVVVSRDVTHD